MAMRRAKGGRSIHFMGKNGFAPYGPVEVVTNPNVVNRLRQGNLQFGHAGRHRGDGSPDCPKHLHHHHDQFCRQPTVAEWLEAGYRYPFPQTQSR